VKQAIPHLRLLDDEPLGQEDGEMGQGETRREASVFDEDWRLLEELMKEGGAAISDECIEIPGSLLDKLRILGTG